jgi:TM2 domain-containing membrane protein YozV
MSGGFGRKGVMAGAPMPPPSPRVTNLPPSTPSRSQDELSRRQSGFDAAESAMAFAPTSSGSEKSLIVAYVLWWFAGIIGAHRLYLGAAQSGLGMLGLFFGGIAVGLADVPIVGVPMIVASFGWALVDAFLIPGLRRRYAQG